MSTQTQAARPANQAQTVPVTLGGVTRSLEIRRTSPDGQTWGVWWGDSPVTCRFPTGGKLHTAARYVVDSKGGEWVVRPPVVRNRRVTPIAWADLAPGDSEWTAKHNPARA